MEPLQVLRPLGKLEQFSSSRHHLNFFNNVGITSTYKTSNSSTTLQRPTIYAALNTLIQAHPILSAIPVNEDTSSPHWARLPTINLSNSVFFITRKSPFSPEQERDKELDTLLERQHNTPFKDNYGTLPFWRLYIQQCPQTPEVFITTFIFHHALGDGASSLVFLQDFYAAINKGTTATKENHIITPPQTQLLPNVELLHELPYTEANPSNTAKEPLLWAGAPNPIPTTTSSHFLSTTLSQSTTSALLKSAKEHQTTLGALLPALIASSLFNYLSKTYNTLEGTIPTNIRRWIPTPITPTSIGVFYDALIMTFTRSQFPDPFTWSAVSTTSQAIANYISSAGNATAIGKFKYIPNFVTAFKSRLDSERTASFDVSNIGSFRVGNERVGEWEMGRVVFSRSVFVTGSAISTSVVTGPDGCLVFGFSWQEGVVSEDIMDGVIEGLKREIKNIVGV